MLDTAPSTNSIVWIICTWRCHKFYNWWHGVGGSAGEPCKICTLLLLHSGMSRAAGDGHLVHSNLAEIKLCMVAAAAAMAAAAGTLL